jgi:L-threonylcarbamoyladenylate synthase
VSARYECGSETDAAAGIAAAVEAVRAGDLVVLPTDTVYGLGADAFNPSAITGLMTARGQPRTAPLTVLVGTVRAANALIEDLNDVGRGFIEEFWPGPLTLVFRVGRTLTWDLGDSRGTVAIRMPMHQVALDLLKQTGPLAVSSASTAGHPAAMTVDDAVGQLGEAVAVYLDDGPGAGGVPSTIVDLTGFVPRLLRDGPISVERLSAVAYVSPPQPAAPPQAADQPTPEPPASGESQPGEPRPGESQPGESRSVESHSAEPDPGGPAPGWPAPQQPFIRDAGGEGPAAGEPL